jgi:hypothetical protein
MYTALRTKPSRPEDHYFHFKDAELLARAREAARASRSGLIDPEPERRALADAIGVDEADMVHPLFDAGLRASSVAILESLPVLEVAWVDDLDLEEREELRRQFITCHASDSSGLGLLTEWLFVRPPDAVLVAARRALAHRLRQMTTDRREEALDRIVSRCEAVARASGGLMGLGALSRTERRHIVGIRRDLQAGP